MASTPPPDSLPPLPGPDDGGAAPAYGQPPDLETFQGPDDDGQLVAMYGAPPEPSPEPPSLGFDVVLGPLRNGYTARVGEGLTGLVANGRLYRQGEVLDNALLLQDEANVPYAKGPLVLLYPNGRFEITADHYVKLGAPLVDAMWSKC